MKEGLANGKNTFREAIRDGRKNQATGKPAKAADSKRKVIVGNRGDIN
jgi:hypothetical protein